MPDSVSTFEDAAVDNERLHSALANEDGRLGGLYKFIKRSAGVQNPPLFEVLGLFRT
jgi:hypothetical protein